MGWAKSILLVVIKPYDGMKGRDVYVKLSDYNEFVHCFNQVGCKHKEVLSVTIILFDLSSNLPVEKMVISCQNQVCLMPLLAY
ncbi:MULTISPECIES: hypothetical protein [Oceanobacillus]|uniref:hypothetical protein n=1 Tax=Oceanobacillus TaxID=182709 RepID=UPI001112DFC4|nr:MULTISPECIES: hypothetical protein [Oceanobacillus]MBT2598602.1 hypothetical protein [Oceanobacillus sp. ISL-74]MBT2651521.1 hypothetical protein [Oceanobacillus sp. ISL-73]